MGYGWLQGETEVTRGAYKALQWITRGYKGLQGVTRGYRGFQGVARSYKRLKGVTGITVGDKG